MADDRGRRRRARLRRRARRDRLPPRADAEGRPRRRPHQAGLAGDVERPHRRGARGQGAAISPRRRGPCWSPATSNIGRDRSRTTSGPCSSVLDALLSPLLVGSVRLPEPDRLDRAPDDARPRPPSDRRLRRLPRGAGSGRRRADRPRGDGRRPVRAPDSAHPRGLPGGLDRRVRPRRRGRAAARGTALRPALPRRAGADREPAAHTRDLRLGGPEPPLPRRAARRYSGGHRVDHRRLRALCRQRGRRRSRRDRDLGRPQLPRGAVLHARPEPARRRVGRAGDASSSPCSRPFGERRGALRSACG